VRGAVLGAFAALAVAVVAVGPARADTTKADALFKKGKRLLAEQKYAEACAAFEASQRAEPTIGTQLNVARCYEEWGKLATAYDIYADALKQAESAGDDRVGRIQERLDAVEAIVPTLVINVSADSRPVDLVVKLDGKELPMGELGVPRRLDPGDHVVEYGIGDGPKKRTKLSLVPNAHETVTLEDVTSMQAGGPVEEELEKPDGDDLNDAPPPTGSSGRTRRLLGLGLAGAGLLSVGISSWIVLDARADYRAAHEAHCNDMNMCDAIGLDGTHAARSRANVGTVLFSLGAAAIAGGVVLYLTAPKGRASVERRAAEPEEPDADAEPEAEPEADPDAEALRLMPVITPDVAGLVLTGGF
jgi:tetratricopeptide (TPR) repeat protein